MQFIPRDENGNLPLSRATDPATSREAERFMRESGRLAAQHRQVLHILTNYPGHTAREYDDGGYLGTTGIFHRRLVELLRLGKVRQGEPRKSKGSRCRAATWWPLETEKAES